MNAIEVKCLCKSFGAFELKDLDLCLPKGCILGLVGENGAGKSSTIKLLLGSLKPDAGEISILGQPGGRAMGKIKEEIGVVLDTVGFPDALCAKELEKVLEGCYESWDKELFAGYMESLRLPWDKPFKDFSKGMKMKLGIAAALSHRPKLLILDEATGGLDPVVRDEVTDLFAEFTRDEEHAILISSHIVSDLEKLCDYIAFLHEGRLLVCEEKDELLRLHGKVLAEEADIDALSAGAVLTKRSTPYGAEAVVRREKLPAGAETGPVTLEELFVAMIREARG